MKFPTIICVLIYILSSFRLQSEEADEKSFICHSNEPSATYDLDFVELIEMIYGEGLLSQGGLQSIDEMLEGIELNGLKVLDLGSGLGMYDIYLAKNYDIEIIGVDPQQSLVEISNFNLKKAEKELKGHVSFILMENSKHLNQFTNNAFDLVFSKESILHVPLEDKQAYLQEIYRVVKPGGKVVIMDWTRTPKDYSENTKKMMEMDGIAYQLLTFSEYHCALKNAGFNIIQTLDTTAKHVKLSQQNIDKIITLEKEIERKFGRETYLYSLQSWTYQRDAFKIRDLMTVIFKAEK